MEDFGNYLGLPTEFGRSKKQAFGYIKESLCAEAAGWKKKMLSPAGKEVLHKCVALALPIYAMDCFKLLKTLCKKMNSALANFWWGSAGDTRKIHWMCWSKLTEKKNGGCLGFVISCALI